MCDICFPRAVPRAATPTGVQPTPRAARTAPPRAAAPRRPASAPAGTAPKLPPFGTRRLYHWTPLTNLESILLDGAVRAPGAGVVPDVDLVSPLVRELRAHADVGDGRTVAEFVPLAVSPDAERWAELRDGADAPHWSAAARALTPGDYAVLVVVAKDLGADVVVADGDAAAAGTRFTAGDPARAVAQAARADPELGAVEVLVPGEVPVARLNLIAVANEPARARVRRMFADVDGTAPKVVVHPPWFLPAG